METTKQVDAAFPSKLAFLFQPWRYKVAYGGRGGAKSWGFARGLLIQGSERPLRIACARETMQSIEESVHQLLADQILALGLSSFYRIEKARILGANGTQFSFHGLREQSVHNIKSLEGADRLWVEEAQNVSKRSWQMVIPTIRKDDSEIWVSFNPELETDETYRRFVLTPPPNAKVEKITWRDNPWLPAVLKQELEHMRLTDAAAFEHVWEGMCKQVVEGAVYRAELLAAEKAQRVCRVPYDSTKPVDTFWDLGWGDCTSVWFAQSIGFEFRVIDFLEGSQQKLGTYLKALQDRGYVYGTHFLPHDARAHELGSGKTIEEHVRAVYPNVQIVPKLSLQDGIEAVRAIFGRCWFDAERCADGLQALKHYRYERDNKPHPENKPAFKREPMHDWSSHAADGFRYLAVAIREPERQRQEAREEQRYGSDIAEQAWMA